MIKQKNLPSVFWFDGATYFDLSFNLSSFGRDASVIPLETDDFIYFGLYKPFKALYTEISVANVVSATLDLEYWNGSAWTNLSGIIEDTKAFSRAGFIQFDKPSDWAKTTVNGSEKFFIRMAPSVNLTVGTSIQGMNIVFSDDQDLKGIYPAVSNYLGSTETTFILRHENSRDLMVQELRNRAFQKKGNARSYYESLEPWDILEIDEVRMWSANLTMANIFSSLQANSNDLYSQKAEEFIEKAEYYKAAVFLTLDKDDDGVMDSVESASDISTRRLVRR